MRLGWYHVGVTSLVWWLPEHPPEKLSPGIDDPLWADLVPWQEGASLPMWYDDGYTHPPVSYIQTYGCMCSDLLNWSRQECGLPPLGGARLRQRHRWRRGVRPDGAWRSGRCMRKALLLALFPGACSSLYECTLAAA